MRMLRPDRRITTLLLTLLGAVQLAAQSSTATINGKGDQLTEAITLTDGLLIVGAGYKGRDNFVVQLLSADGETRELLVNAIGDYQGVRLVPVKAGRYRFQVEADRAWVLMHEQPDPAKAGSSLPISHRHTGDAPLGPFTFRRGLLRASFTHQGSGNFVARLFHPDGEMVRLLVNEIGVYEGTVSESIRMEGTYWLEVQANGPWSVELQIVD